MHSKNMILTSKKTICLWYCLFLLPGLALYAGNANGGLTGFIENKGQVLNQRYEPNSNVLFLYSAPGIKIQLRKTGYSYELFKVNAPSLGASNKARPITREEAEQTRIESYRVDVDFKTTNTIHEIIKELPGNDCLNYYVCGQQALNVRAWKKVTYKNVYPNTDIEFTLNETGPNPLKYNIILHAGANPDAVLFMIHGAEEVVLNNEDLNIKTPYGIIKETIPLSYYVTEPTVSQPVSFRLSGNVFSFATSHNRNKTFIIDPSSNLIWSTYYGGTSALDYCKATATDAQNNVYIAGHCLSTSNIATSGSYQAVLMGGMDAYLAKFNSNGVRQWGTYFGGSNYDQVFSMCIAGGNIYLSGDTFSSSGIATPGAYQTAIGSSTFDDAILVKFDTTGQRLWATYFGGAKHDISQAVTVDSNGDVIMAGHTESTNDIATPGAYSTAYNLSYDVFVAKFSSAGARLWGTYYGDSGIDEAYGIACDAPGNIYITGLTQSVAGISGGSGHQMNAGGLQDAYLAKFNPLGSSLLWGSYYGGSGNDLGTVVRVNNAGTIVLAGTTASSNNIAAPGAYQPALGSADDAFIATFSNAGTRQWASYFGGNNVDYINDLATDANANILVCGQTLSTLSISTAGAYQTALSTINNYDAYFARFSAAGQKKHGSYFGGPANDNACALTIDNTGKVYIAGETSSTVNIAGPAAHQPNSGGSQDGFLARLCLPLEPLLSPSGTATLCMGSSTLWATAGYDSYLWNGTFTLNPLVVNYSAQGDYYFSVFVTDGYGCSGQSDSLHAFIGDCYVSLKENTAGSFIHLYPVPAGDMLTLELSTALADNSITEIYTASGQRLSTCPVYENINQLSIQQLPPGLYLLRVKTSAGTFEKKFIKD